MRDSPLLFGLASVFAGLTTMLAVVAIVTRELFVLAIALPFAATGYFMWYQATGRMRERVAQGTHANAERDARRFAEQKAREGAQSRFAREARRRANREQRRRARGDGRGRRASAAGGSTGGRRRRRARQRDEPTLEEAYRVLDVDASADRDDIREAYRERVKEVHPDTEAGDEESFKRVNAAYERLTDD